MRFEDIKVGMKVIPISKNGSKDMLDTCSSIYKHMLELKQKYAYVIRIEDNSYYNTKDNIIVLSHDVDLDAGDYFTCEDLLSYSKEERKQKLKRLEYVQNWG